MAHWFRYYGTENETILEIDPGYPNEGIYVIQSPDLSTDAAEISRVPDEFELIPDDEAAPCGLPLPEPEDIGNMMVAVWAI